MQFNPDKDEKIRAAAFEWLARQVAEHEHGLPYDLLRAGFKLDEQLRARFKLDEERVQLVSQRGIFRPTALDVPLSIRTSPRNPYKDKVGDDGRLEYDYFGTNKNPLKAPHYRDNRGLRFAMQNKLPLVYFRPVTGDGGYEAIWPAYVDKDQPEKLVFIIKLPA